MGIDIKGLRRLREIAACAPSARGIILRDVADQIESEVEGLLRESVPAILDPEVPRDVRIAELEGELAALRSTRPVD